MKQIDTLLTPKIGETIYGCTCYSSACGSIREVIRRVETNAGGYWNVIEDWNNRRIKVRRESNGSLYEVKITTDYSGM